MSASAENTTYPTAKEIPAKTNSHIWRLTWLWRQPLETAITVLDDATDPLGPSRPYYQQVESGSNTRVSDSDGDGGSGFQLHEISQEPATNPPVSSITVDCEEWDAWHSLTMLYCNDPEEELVYDDENYPPPSAELLVTASGERGYVTIHDYITQVWPWIFEHRHMILKSLDPDSFEEAMRTDWVIVPWFVGTIILTEKENWPIYQKNSAERILKERGDGKNL